MKDDLNYFGKKTTKILMYMDDNLNFKFNEDIINFKVNPQVNLSLVNPNWYGLNQIVCKLIAGFN